MLFCTAPPLLPPLPTILDQIWYFPATSLPGQELCGWGPEVKSGIHGSGGWEQRSIYWVLLWRIYWYLSSQLAKICNIKHLNSDFNLFSPTEHTKNIWTWSSDDSYSATTLKNCLWSNCCRSESLLRVESFYNSLCSMTSRNCSSFRVFNLCLSFKFKGLVKNIS